MLSRRHLRIKVLQSIYAFIQSENDRLDAGERQMLKSFEKLEEEYIYILSFLVGVFDFAERRIEEAKNKFLPTEEDLKPNTRFVNNAFIKQLSGNPDFAKREEQLKINWSEETEMIRKTYQNIRESQDYKEYMTSAGSSLKADREFIILLLRKFIANSETLEYYFEERNIFWAADFNLAVWLAIKTVKTIDEHELRDGKLPSMIKTENMTDNEDHKFIVTLYRKTLLKRDRAENLIAERAKNWELDRIAMMDKIILAMAITELIEFPSIPVKVSLNEYIEIAKIFSTAKSRIFINGILDKLISDLQADNTIIKTGRGLMS